MQPINITQGFQPAQRGEAVRCYWAAFGPKLNRILGPQTRGEAFLSRVMQPAFAICAIDADERLLGIAGYKSGKGGLVGGGFNDLRSVYGLWGAIWRLAPLSLLERPARPGILQMDGICVSPDARGRGVGTLLLDAITAQAAAQGASCVRLDVIDSNPRARALYERFGFRADHTRHMGPLRWLFGFRSATQMTLDLAGLPEKCRDAAN